MIARVVAWCTRHHWLVIATALVLGRWSASSRAGRCRATRFRTCRIRRSCWWPTGWDIRRPRWPASVTKVLTDALARHPRLDRGARVVDVRHGVRRRRLRIVPEPGARARRPSSSGSTKVRAEAARERARAGRARGVQHRLGVSIRAGGSLPQAASPGAAAPAGQRARSRARLDSRRGGGRLGGRRRPAGARRGQARPAPRRGASPSRTCFPRCARRRRVPQNLQRTRSDSRWRLPSAQRRGSSLTRIGDVAQVTFPRDMPTGLRRLSTASLPAVGGIVIAKRDADPAAVVEQRQAQRSTSCARGCLPRVELVTVYDRLDLVTRVGRTLLRALAEEVAVVVLVILMFLLHVRSALVPLATLPVGAAPDLRGHVAAGRARHDHEPGRDRHRARHGRRRRRRRARGVSPPTGGHGRELVRRGAARGDHRRGRLVRAGDPDLAADHRAQLLAGVRVHRRDRAAAASAGDHQDAGDRFGRAGGAHAGARAARSPAARPGDAGVRQSPHPRAGARSIAPSCTSRCGGRS